MSNYDTLKSLVERISGQAVVITVLRIYLDIFDDLDTAAVLSQCMFWSDKGKDGDGWFYKSQPEWRNEIGVKRSTLETAIERLITCGIVETKVKGCGKGNSPTTHYWINMDELTNLPVRHLKEQLTETNGRSVGINRSTR